MINLLPYKEKKIIERMTIIRMVHTTIKGVGALLFILAILLVPTLLTINSRFTLANDQIKLVQKNSMIPSDIDLTTLEQRAVAAQAKLASTPRTPPTQYIALIKEATPPGIVIRQFGTEDGLLFQVSGVSENRELLQSFIAVLQANGQVATVDNPVSNFIKNKNGEFKLSISFK